MALCKRTSGLLSRTRLVLAAPCGALPFPLWLSATFSRVLPFCPVKPNQQEAGPGQSPTENLVSKNIFGNLGSIIMLYKKGLKVHVF